MTFFVSKYALTEGLIEVEGEVAEHFPGMLTYRTPTYRGTAHGEGRQWHRTREAAVAKAEQMRKTKIASHRKSIAKLEALTFGEPQ